jgi:hypothetical protein
MYWSRCSDEKIEKIKDPVLVLQNLDDNRVPADIAFNWYDKALASGKEKLVRLHLTKVGNALKPDEPSLKGHFSPRGDDAFEHYMQTILGFMLHGVESIPATSEWLLTKSRMSLSLAHPNRTKYPVDEIFLSAAYRYFKENEKEAAGSGWTPVMKMLSNVFLGPGYGDFYETEFSGKSAPEISEADWKKVQPLLFGIDFIPDLSFDLSRNLEILKNILNRDPQRSVTLANGLRQLLPSFLSFLDEKQIDTVGLSVTKLIKNTDLQERYFQFLTTPFTEPNPTECTTGSVSRRAYEYLLLSLFRGNIGKIREFMSADAYERAEKKWADKSEQLRIKFNKILKTRADEKAF